MQVSNGRIPKNKVIPVQKIEGRKQEPDAGEQKKLTTENLWQSVSQKMESSPDSAPSSPEKLNSQIHSPIRVVTHAKVNALKWRRFARKRSEKNNLKQYEKARISLPKGLDKFRTCHMNAAQLSDLEDMTDGDNHLNDKRKQRTKSSINSPSRALIYYFAKLASSDEDQVIDLEFVNTLITNGASPNICDRHGQSILHEAARQWELGVAKFLLAKGKFKYFYWRFLPTNFIQVSTRFESILSAANNF